MFEVWNDKNWDEDKTVYTFSKEEEAIDFLKERVKGFEGVDFDEYPCWSWNSEWCIARV